MYHIGTIMSTDTPKSIAAPSHAIVDFKTVQGAIEMRMRELEERSGVGRETVRYYIREGLLPEPARASRNSASYSDAHVTRLRAIKRLQEERFLPLAVIRTLLDSDAAERLLAFPELGGVLRARLDHDAPRVGVDALIAELGIAQQQIDDNVAVGAITVDANATLSARDAEIMRLLVGLAATGFDVENGFQPETLRFYVEFIEWLTTAELRMFFENTAGRVGEAQAADMAERGVAGINELLGLLRTRALLAKLAQRRHGANDNV